MRTNHKYLSWSTYEHVFFDLHNHNKHNAGSVPGCIVAGGVS